MTLLAIDPGISSGWAVFENGRLVRCGATDNVTAGVVGRRPDVLIIEVPQVYTARLMKGDPNNLITLALQVGRYIERFESTGALVKTVKPGEWKGQLEKSVHHPRIYASLSPEEKEIVSQAGRRMAKKPLGDMMDAIGLGRYALRFSGLGKAQP